MEDLIEELFLDYETFKNTAISKSKKGEYLEAARFENIALGIYMARQKIIESQGTSSDAKK